MNKEKIYISINKNEWNKIAKFGWLKGINTTTAWRGDILKEVKEAIYLSTNLQDLYEITQDKQCAENVMVDVAMHKI